MAVLTVDNVSIGSFNTFNFAAINDTFDASNCFDLTIGGDLQINGAGVYGLHFKFTGLSTTAHKSGMLFVSGDVISGSNGLWSSASAGDDMDAQWAVSIEDFNQFDIGASGAGTIPAYAAWATSDTFPVVVQFAAEYAEDGVATSATPDFRLTVIRFGAADA